MKTLLLALLMLTLPGCTPPHAPKGAIVAAQQPAARPQPPSPPPPPDDIGRTCTGDGRQVVARNLTPIGQVWVSGFEKYFPLSFGDRCWVLNGDQWTALGEDDGRLLIRYTRGASCGWYKEECCPDQTLFFLYPPTFAHQCRQDEERARQKAEREEQERQDREAVRRILEHDKAAVQKILGEQ